MISIKQILKRSSLSHKDTVLALCTSSVELFYFGNHYSYILHQIHVVVSLFLND